MINKSVKLLFFTVFAFIAMTAISCKENEPTPEPTPVVNFYFKVVDKQVEFRALSNYGAFQWDFGDGRTSSEKHPVHTYSEAGTYSVTLKRNGGGAPNDVISKNVEIN